MAGSALGSLGGDLTVAVVGASGGIGSAFCRLLAQDPGVARCLAFSRKPPSDPPPGVNWQALDLQDPDAPARAFDAALGDASLHLVVVATGRLHDGAGNGPEKSTAAMRANNLLDSYVVNAVGPALVAQAALPRLVRGRKSVFAALSARVGSVSDNRLGGWHAYRASKAALNMLIRTMAIEHSRRNPESLCVGLHPGTVDTPLSRPFQGAVPAGRLFTAEAAARSLLGVIDGLEPSQSGRLFAWDGQEIAP